MKVRPWYFTVLGWGYIFIALAFPLQVMWLYGHGPNEFLSVYQKLTWTNLLCMFGLTWVGIMGLRVDPCLRTGVFIIVPTVLFNNLLVGIYGEDFGLLQTSLSGILFALPSLAFANSSQIELIYRPWLHWWPTPKRYRMRLKAIVSFSNQFSLKAETFDMSRTGVFVWLKTPSDELRELSSLIKESDIELLLKTKSGPGLRWQGRVVRQERGPKGRVFGLGIQFGQMSWLDRIQLLRLISRQKGSLLI